MTSNNYCNRCGGCCKKIKADKEKKILYRDGTKPMSDKFADMLLPISNEQNLYFCKYLVNNLCTNENKPEICRLYPSDPFVELPENCGYNGYIFMLKEKVMQKIRKLKEEIIHYNAIILTTTDKQEQKQLTKIVETYQRQIDKYKEFGSADW